MATKDDVEKIDIEEVLHRNYDKVSLVEIEPKIKVTKTVLTVLLSSNNVEMGDSIWNNVISLTNQFVSYCNQAKQLDIANPSFHPLRNDVMSGLKGVWNSVIQYRPLAYSLSGSETEELAKRARASLTEIQSALEDVNKAKQEANKAAGAAREASALTAVTNLTKAFEDEATTNAKRARKWFIGSLVCATCGIIVLGIFITESFTNINLTIAHSILRGVVLSIIYGAFHLCLRTFQAFTHLEIVNKHRVNIGLTYKAFLEAQPNERAKEMMAIMSAQHILSFGKSGLIPKDPTMQTPTGTVADLFQNIVDSKTK